MKVDTEQHTSPLKLLYIKSFILPQFRRLCTVKFEKSRAHWIRTNPPAPFLSSNNETSLKVFLYVYVNVSIRKLYCWMTSVLFVSIFVVYPLKSPCACSSKMEDMFWFLSRRLLFLWLEGGDVWKPLWQFYMTSYLLYQGSKWHLRVVQRRK